MPERIGLRYKREWDITTNAPAIHDTLIPVCRQPDGQWVNAISLRPVPTAWIYPLAGHSGACIRVTSATIGQLTDACDCGAQA